MEHVVDRPVYQTQLQMVWPAHWASAPRSTILPPDYVLEQCRSQDHPKFFHLMNLVGWPDWDEARLEPFLRRTRESWFVIWHKPTGALVASAMGVDDPSEFHPGGGELGWVAANPEHSGNGLGFAVCREVVARLLDLGYPNIHLYTEDWRLPALRTYLKLGFLPLLYASDMEERWSRVFSILEMPADSSHWIRHSNFC